jgi:hypothetical protein
MPVLHQVFSAVAHAALLKDTEQCKVRMPSAAARFTLYRWAEFFGFGAIRV